MARRRGRRKVGDARLREAIIASRANLTQAAALVDMSRQQVGQRVSESPDLKALVEELRAQYGFPGKGRRSYCATHITDEQVEAALRKHSVCITTALAMAARSLGITRAMLAQRLERSDGLRAVVEDVRQEMLQEAIISWRALARGEKIGGRTPHWSAVNKVLEIFGGLVSRTELTGSGGGPVQWQSVVEERRKAAVELRLWEQQQGDGKAA